jgi:hypothetical protein
MAEMLGEMAVDHSANGVFAIVGVDDEGVGGGL